MTLTNYFDVLNDNKIQVFYEKIDNKILAQKIAKEKNDDEPFLIMNLTILVEKFFEWKKNLPRILPCYAVKCNDDPMILKTLANLGCGFDCASKNEINKIMKLGIVGPEKIIYANPCKTKSFIVHADQVGVHRMTFDNVEELVKVKELHCNPL
uniref:Ornithine decarboxylase n=1 Tax=Panagrolaimus sp. JU765 TaxID=591449 RepID=A0AC34QWY7_9BILA